MESTELVAIVSLVTSISVLFFIIWDHIKDDRILSMEVQEFYEDIEMLIYTNLQVEYYESLQEKEEKIDADEITKLKKNKNRDVIQKNYLTTKIKQHFKLYSQYLGLTINKDDSAYLNGTIFILKQDGILLKRNIESNTEEMIFTNYTDIKQAQITEILNYLNSLRFYWGKKYRKFIFRPGISQKIDFSILLGFVKPLDFKTKGRSRRFGRNK